MVFRWTTGRPPPKPNAAPRPDHVRHLAPFDNDWDLSAVTVGRATLRLIAFCALTLLLVPVQWISLMIGLDVSRRIPILFHRGLCRLLSLEVVRSGEALAEGPALLVANHASWLDIPVLGSLAPVVFIAKQEVANWPFFGSMPRLQRTIFVERQRTKVGRHRDVINERLSSGDRLILFAEGTSSDGNRVLPFKSALFSAAERHIDGHPVKVQPLSVAFTHFDGMPLGRQFRHYYAWYGDMDLLPHLWRVFRVGHVRIEVQCHPSVTIEAFANRKELAQHCHSVVAASVAEALTGHRGIKATETPSALAMAERP